jgi:PadR family transcriptional regulator, regulatory protein PadR
MNLWMRSGTHFDNHILTIIWSERSVSSMDDPNTDVIQGTLDMLILKTLSLEPMHGFGIARRVEQISRGVFKVNPGSLLTALQRLERAGLLDAEWRQTANSRRAKFYTLTRAGMKRLEVETAEWTRRASAIARLLRTEG